MLYLIRAGMCLGISLLLLGSVMFAMSQDHRDPIQPDMIGIEHRFTALETKVDTIFEQIQEEKYMKWLELLGIAGLIGDTGLRALKKKDLTGS